MIEPFAVRFYEEFNRGYDVPNWEYISDDEQRRYIDSAAAALKTLALTPTCNHERPHT